MVRQHTSLAQRASPLAAHYPKSARYGIRPPPKAPHASRNPITKSPRAKLQAPATAGRFLRSRALPTIREEPEEDTTYELYRDLDAFARDEERATLRHQQPSPDDDEMDWDEETTLVAMLQDITPEKDEQEELVALANKLKAPMSAQGAALKQYLANTLVPVVTRVKEVHGILEDEVDLAFGTGILTFDEVCKKVEAMALRDEVELKVAYMDSQSSMKHLLTQLQQAYARRDGLWSALSKDLDKCADQAVASLENLPINLERTITQLEKKSKDLYKDSSAASKQKMLKGLLEKL
ncbi:hypothetical protein B0H21DRAFT_724041 [Amylocystis lapponica]|nr:hypothetical protein B0H21DRAFT_724041 [Amylocystis lapponica]